MTMTKAVRLRVLRAAMDCVETMHGSVIGEPEFDHASMTPRCACEYGSTLRGLIEMRKEVRLEKATFKHIPKGEDAVSAVRSRRTKDRA